MIALGNIGIQVLNGTSTRNYDRIADNMRRRAIGNSRAKSNVIKYHTNGLTNKTFKNIDAVVNGLDFIGFAGDGSIEDSEMLRSHLVRTKDIIDSAPQMFNGYQQPRQLSSMLGFVIDAWDTPDREAAIDNMAREERKLMAIGAIKADNESDAHYLTDGEIYDADRQNVVKNGMVETKPGYRGLFNRIKAAGVNANVLSKDAEIVTDNTLTRKAVGTLRDAVKKARTNRPKMLRKTRIQNGYVHTSVVRLPQQTATTADTIKILSRTPEGKKLAETIKEPTVNGLGEIEQGTLTELLHGTDFAFNGTDGLSGVDNIDNYRRYFTKLKWAIVANPKGFYNTKAEADAVVEFLDALYAVLGDDAAMDNLLRRYSQGINGVCDGAALGALGGKLKNALKKTASAVKKSVKNVAKTTANATKQVAKTTANVTKAAAKTTAQAAKNVAKTTAAAAKTAVKATTSAAKATVQSTVNATKAAANVAKAAAQAATGNKDKAKETLQKAASQAKAAVTQPVKTVVNTTKTAVKETIINPTVSAAKTTAQAAKTLAKETKAAVKNTIVEPTKTVVKETIVNPTKAALKITKKVTKQVIKVAKKVIRAILLYNPITLLIKAGLLIAFRLNMFKMASRSYAGSYTEEEFAVFAEKNGIEVSNYSKFKDAYDKIRKIFTKIGGKESKMLEALKKGSARKWSGLDAADYNEENAAEFTQQVTEAGEEADNSAEFQAEMAEINQDTAAEEAELKAQGAQSSDEAPTDELVVEREVETTEMVEQVANARIVKSDTPLYETADTKGKQIAALKKGDTVYIDESQASGNLIAAATIDDKNGFVDKNNLAEFSSAEDVAVNGIAGLIDNGYEYVAGLGEAVTAAAATTAASGTIATICVSIGRIFKGGLEMVKNVAEGAQTVAEIKEAFDTVNNNGDEIQEYDVSQMPLTAEQQAMYQQQQLPGQTATAKKSNLGLIIGIGAVAAVGAGIFFMTRNN